MPENLLQALKESKTMEKLRSVELRHARLSLERELNQEAILRYTSEQVALTSYRFC